MTISLSQSLPRKLRMGLIGGGGSGFIGRVHALAAQLDQRAELVAGALSSNPTKARAAASGFGIAEHRAYGCYRELFEREALLPEDRRIDFVSIATPNHTHFEIARAALDAGFHVVCDKPMTTRLGDAVELARLVGDRQAVFALMHNYTGYPLVRQAREMTVSGELGEIQAVRVQYVQGWLCGFRLDPHAARGVWKSDPSQAGSGSLGDIATHAFHLAGYVTGLQPIGLSAMLRTYHRERTLDDYGHALLNLGENRLALISFSQITHGRLNDLTLEVDGTRASLTWRQEQPNQLVVRRTGQAIQTYERHPSAAYANASERAACRLPGGHPEGFLEAFANVYQSAFDEMAMTAQDRSASSDYPNVADGVAGVRFVVTALASSQQNGAWLSLEESIES